MVEFGYRPSDADQNKQSENIKNVKNSWQFSFQSVQFAYNVI